MAVVAFPVRNKLAYPAGCAPGFDPTHPAAQNMSSGHGYSGVAQSGDALRSLLNGTLAAFTGTQLPQPIDANIGAGVRGNVTGFFSYFTIAGNAAVVDSKVTLAGIIRYKTSAASQPIFSTTITANTGAELFVTAAGGLAAFSATTGPASTFTLNANEAYFVAYSDNGLVSNFFARSLQTGKVSASTDVSAAPAASDGSYRVGIDAFSNEVKFPIAAVSFTPSYLSMLQLLAWSADPWAFWYPPQAGSLIATTAVTPPTTVLYSLMNVG